MWMHSIGAEYSYLHIDFDYEWMHWRQGILKSALVNFVLDKQALRAYGYGIAFVFNLKDSETRVVVQ
jgi:hypothetical protein